MSWYFVPIEAGEEVEDVGHDGASADAGGAVQVPVHVLHRPVAVLEHALRHFCSEEISESPRG